MKCKYSGCLAYKYEKAKDTINALRKEIKVIEDKREWDFKTNHEIFEYAKEIEELSVKLAKEIIDNTKRQVGWCGKSGTVRPFISDDAQELATIIINTTCNKKIGGV
jgi:hypothetical protein